MLAKVLSSAVVGIEAYIVEVEVDITTGFPAFSTVGLPDKVSLGSHDSTYLWLATLIPTIGVSRIIT